MSRESEYGTRSRVLYLLRLIAESPNFYTKQALAQRHGVHVDTISGDFDAMRTAGFVLDCDTKNRYFFVLDKPLKQLKDLLHFSEEDQVLLHQAIDNLPTSTERQQKLKEKLASVYDYKRLGFSYLRKPYLSKVDILRQAQLEKRQVILEDYRSSKSSTIKNRLVEPFHVSPPDDTVQTFDVEKRVVNHFLISRIQRVKILDTTWQFEGHHNIRHTDPFRIVNNDQVLVHLRFDVGAFNELVERFPMTRQHILEAEEEGVYDFQCMVNRNFYGLSNFILGFYHKKIEVLEPDSLREHLRAEISKMSF